MGSSVSPPRSWPRLVRSTLGWWLVPVVLFGVLLVVIFGGDSMIARVFTYAAF